MGLDLPWLGLTRDAPVRVSSGVKTSPASAGKDGGIAEDAAKSSLSVKPFRPPLQRAVVGGHGEGGSSGLKEIHHKVENRHRGRDRRELLGMSDSGG